MATTCLNTLELASRPTAETSQVKGLQDEFCKLTYDHCYHHAALPDTFDKIHLRML